MRYVLLWSLWRKHGSAASFMFDFGLQNSVRKYFCCLKTPIPWHLLVPMFPRKGAQIDLSEGRIGLERNILVVDSQG